MSPLDVARLIFAVLAYVDQQQILLGVELVQQRLRGISLTQDFAARTKSIRPIGCSGLKVLYIGNAPESGLKNRNLKVSDPARRINVL